MNTRARYLHCIYADDVRQEASGKMLIVGMYPGDMQVGKLPATLPQLAVIATLSMPREADTSPESLRSLKLVLSYDDKELVAIDAPVEVLPASQAPPDTDAIGYMVQMVVQVAPLVLETEAKIRVSAIINGSETLAGNSLKVKLRKTQASPVDEAIR